MHGPSLVGRLCCHHRMEAPGRSILVDLSEDTLCCILSFLRPADVSVCSRVCKRLRDLCCKEGTVWAQMCGRRWGSLTNLSRWGNGRIPHRLLYGILDRWEHLIGFWRTVGDGGCGFLALFEWVPHCIVGHKVVPAGLDSYCVCKIPFLWMTITEDGQMACFLHPAFKNLRASDGGSLSAAMSASSNTVSLVPDFDPKASCGMLSVNVHFVGNHHLVIEEIVQHSGCVLNELAEAATLAALGSRHNLANLSPAVFGHGASSNGVSPCSSSSESESCIESPPGSFQYEMYQFLVSKVASAGGDRAARKQKRRDKERAWNEGRGVFKPEHFVKVIHASPTKSRPLQGLWKGFFDPAGLDFVVVSCDDKEGIVCRKVQDFAGTSKSGSVMWTSESNMRVARPADRVLYNSRTHTGPLCLSANLGFAEGAPLDFCEEVVGVLCTSSCDSESLLASNIWEGRIWQYANGTFAFGFLHSSLVIDFRPLCSAGSLLDVIQ